ncbi:MAG: hypothetical protein IJS09_00450 [Treponema sp.]|nr:hypothetical protein [Treponema sp.]
MATSANILVLLKFFASKQGSAVIDYTAFCSYLKKYAEHHLADQPALVDYVSDPVPPLQREIDKLQATRQVLVVNTTPTKQAIVVIPFFNDLFADRYKDLLANPGQAFPSELDLPKNIPPDILNRQNATELIFRLLNKPEKVEKTLYGLVMPNDMPTIVLPSIVPAETLISASLAKIRLLLSKGDHHDYFLKKMTISNPGREVSAKNFFLAFADKPDAGLDMLKNSGDLFYLWNQLCYFIRQDYEKIKEYTTEDVSRLQAVQIIEIAASYYKDVAQEHQKKHQAMMALEEQLKRPPYYYTLDAICKFTDQKGDSLLGQYSEEELKNYLHTKSTESIGGSLPELLIFKAQDSEQRYFIRKDKVMNLVVRLSSDARSVIRETITKHWNQVLLQYDALPEMKDQTAFERRLEQEVKIQEPILYALLNATFLPVIDSESSESVEGHIPFFYNGMLIPYSEILLMNRNELYTDARIILPFWYTAPLISWIAKLLFRPAKDKREKTPKNSAELYREEEENKRREENLEAEISKNPNINKKVALREAARIAEQELVPQSSTLDRELESYRRQWNHLLGKIENQNLTEDVNSLIRDYLRKCMRTFKTTSLTLSRIKSIAETLVKAPGMQKIKDSDALNMYIQLYLIKLIKNVPM